MRSPALRSLRFALVLLACLAACAPRTPAAAPHAPAHPQRIVSLDFCADQYLLKLADRTQIAALSPDAGRDFSFMRAAAEGVRRVRPRAEDVLALRPDLVVRSYGGESNIASLLARAGIPVAELGFADDFDQVRGSVAAMAAAFGQQPRGEALIADLDRRLAAVAAADQAAPPRPTLLYMTPGGVTTGPGSFVDRLIEAAGLRNFESAPGWRALPLERLARERPDVVASSFFTPHADPGDLWSAARHPIARRAAKESAAVVLDGAWTACGGWFAVEAVEALAKARAQ